MVTENLTAKRKITHREVRCMVGKSQGEETVLIGELQTVNYGTGSIFVAWFAEGLFGAFEYQGEVNGKRLYFVVRRAIQEAYLQDVPV